MPNSYYRLAEVIILSGLRSRYRYHNTFQAIQTVMEEIVLIKLRYLNLFLLLLRDQVLCVAFC